MPPHNPCCLSRQIFGRLKKHRMEADAAEPAGPSVPTGIRIPLKVEEPVRPQRAQPGLCCNS